MRIFRRSPWLAMFLAFAACDTAKPRSPSPAPRAHAPAQPRVPEVENPPRPPISESDVEAVLAQWVDSQNRGDFGEFEALYADRFHAVVRTRVDRRPIDRASWLDDRHAMFERPIVVRADETRVRTNDTTADVTFTQHWSSGRTEENGRKHMLLVRAPEGPRIAIEEMLGSDRPNDLEEELAGPFLVVHEGGAAVAIFARVHPTDATGPFELVGERGGIAVARDFGGDVPDALSALSDADVHVVGRSGACEGKLGAARTFRFVRPHPSELARWRGQGEPAQAASPAERAHEAWDDGVDTYLGAVLEGACEDAVLALRPNARMPETFPMRDPDPEARRTWIDAFAHAPAGRRIEHELAEYIAASEEPPDFDASAWRDGAVGEVVVRLFGRTERPRVAVVSLHSAMCAPFRTRGLTIFDLRQLEPRIQSAMGLPSYADVIAMLDLEGDHVLEAVITTELGLATMLVHLGERPAVLRTFELTYRDDPC